MGVEPFQSWKVLPRFHTSDRLSGRPLPREGSALPGPPQSSCDLVRFLVENDKNLALTRVACQLDGSPLRSTDVHGNSTHESAGFVLLIRAYSDLHGYLPVIEPCDLLLIAGDVCPIDGEYGDHTTGTQSRWLREVFNAWCDVMPVDQIVLIGGNHDAILAPVEGRGYPRKLSDKVTYLLDSSVWIEDGPLIFGQPWIPNLERWPFYKSDENLRELAQGLPDGGDIWMLHSPPGLDSPRYHVDLTRRGEHVGNKFATPIILERGPQVIVCGHIHEGFGVSAVDIGGTKIANAAYVNERYVAHSRHIVINWSDSKRWVESVEQIVSRKNDELWWDWRSS